MTDLPKSGAIILTDGSLEQPTSLRDRRMDESVREVFKMIYPPHKPNDTRDQKLFGTKEPKVAGESWPVDLAFAAADLAWTVIPAGHLTGKVSLVSKEQIGGADCLNLAGEIEADKLGVKEAPPEVHPQLQDARGLTLHQVIRSTLVTHLTTSAARCRLSFGSKVELANGWNDHH
jgi:hypothetical protein